MSQLEFRHLTTNYPLSPKRLQCGEGVDTVYPYYAGFSSAFASHLLEHLKLNPEARVLDPWNGSGTTTYVATNLGHKSIGLDLNPFAALLASAKSPTQNNSEWFHSIAREIISLAQSFIQDSSLASHDPLAEWMTTASVINFRKLFYSIIEFFGLTEDTTLFKFGPPEQAPSLFLIALVRSIKTRLRGSKNPTWNSPEARISVNIQDLEEDFVSNVIRIAEILGSKRIHQTARPQIMISDARQLPITESTVDVVLTSPPYCTRIDYAMATSLELAALGLSADDTAFSLLRKNLMGTTTIREQLSASIPSHWACSVTNLLRQINAHESYASSRYYYRNLFQYFSDAHSAISELGRVLRPGGVGFLVLQNSFFKDIHIPLANLYADIARRYDLHSDIVASFPAKAYFAKINKGAAKYKHEREYEESILYIRK